MKGTLLISVIVIFSMLVIPLSSLPKSESDTIPTSNTKSNVTYEKKTDNIGFEKIRVLKGGTVTEYSASDYIFGVVAAEMPALYEVEALKAQAVAAYTFACYRMQSNTESNYDISSDAETAQCFITREEASARWGEKAQEYAKKIDDCVSAVKGELLTYDQKPVFAAYHAISSGTTNACADVWGKDINYLKSVSSVGDTLSEKYLSEVVFSPEEITEKLKKFATATKDAQNYFTDIKTTDNGFVKSINYCGKTVSGTDICRALNLRSAAFAVSFAGGNFTFTVKGYGHGVGMSQNGADYMAKQGSNYKEILLHYYSGVTLEKN